MIGHLSPTGIELSFKNGASETDTCTSIVNELGKNFYANSWQSEPFSLLAFIKTL